MAEFNSKQKDVALSPFGQNSCVMSTWTEFMNSVFMNFVHLDKVHALCPHGQSSCTMYMWTLTIE